MLVGVHPINSVSLGFVVTESLQHILDFPKFFLKENVLLAGGLHLVVKRKHTLKPTDSGIWEISLHSRLVCFGGGGVTP